MLALTIRTTPPHHHRILEQTTGAEAAANAVGMGGEAEDHSSGSVQQQRPVSTLSMASDGSELLGFSDIPSPPPSDTVSPPSSLRHSNNYSNSNSPLTNSGMDSKNGGGGSDSFYEDGSGGGGGGGGSSATVVRRRSRSSLRSRGGQCAIITCSRFILPFFFLLQMCPELGGYYTDGMRHFTSPSPSYREQVAISAVSRRGGSPWASMYADVYSLMT